ncbi:MAG: SoxR reducing system RseC family protein [Candidatus Aminicenantes bacterium]|jgi:sigma-E factor negative regulatory protein RseC
MADNQLVCHEGKVVGVGTKDGTVQVKILSRSACAQCHARGMCAALEMEEKIIDTIPVSRDPMQIGDTVVVTMEEKLGWKAIFYGFFLPLIVMVTTLFVSYALGSSETQAALYGIGSLIPYYLLLYAFRGKIEKDFIFKAEKKNTF